MTHQGQRLHHHHTQNRNFLFKCARWSNNAVPGAPSWSCHGIEAIELTVPGSSVTTGSRRDHARTLGKVADSRPVRFAPGRTATHIPCTVHSARPSTPDPPP